MARSGFRQYDLFDPMSGQSSQTEVVSCQCEIVPVGKRRSGGVRYWCLRHLADATAKYGTPAPTCRTAHLQPVRPEDILDLDLNRYEGGVALWGAVPPVYDTTRRKRERGVHVHARAVTGGVKQIDGTFRAVRIMGEESPNQGSLISELDAVYFMVTSVFGHGVKYVTCSHCGYAHLDKDWFSVHPHCRHLCAGCGRHFWDSERAVGNPICGLQGVPVARSHRQRQSRSRLRLQQRDFGGGIQIWGSNPAFVWTREGPEEQGIHVHAFRDGEEEPEVDETFSRVTVDGVDLDPVMVRVLMAQRTLSFLEGRVLSMTCVECGCAQFDRDEAAYTPVATHRCTQCGCEFSARGRLRKTVANPLIAVLEEIANDAPRPPQTPETALLPEMP